MRAINELVLAVQHARLEALAANEQIASLRAEWAAQHTSELESQQSSLLHLNEVEHELRLAAIEEYGRTGNKKPHPAVGIRVTQRLVYDEAEALKWAKQHDMALSFDRRQFESIAKAAPPDFVEIEETIVPTIATDIAKATGADYS